MKKLIYFILFSILLGVAMIRSDWIRPPGSGGGGTGDTINNYYNVSGGNSTAQMVEAVNKTTGMYNISVNCSNIIFNGGTKGSASICDGTDATGTGSGTVINPTLLESVVITSDATSYKGLVNKAARNLNFTLISGNYYTVDFHVLYISNDTTNGVKFGVETPTFTFISGDVMINGQAATGTDSDVNGQLIASNGTVTSTAVAVKDTTYAALIHVHILPSANGNIQLIYSNELAACNVTIKQGSSATLTNYTPIGAGAPGK
jgi:hypothetical protein